MITSTEEQIKQTLKNWENNIIVYKEDVDLRKLNEDYAKTIQYEKDKNNNNCKRRI